MTIFSGKHDCPNRLDGCRNCPFCDPECAAIMRMTPIAWAKWNQAKSQKMGIDMNQHRQAQENRTMQRYTDRELVDWLTREMHDREIERTRAAQTSASAPAPPDLFERIRAARGVQPKPSNPVSATPRVAGAAPASAPPPPDLFGLIRAAAREKGK